MPWTAVAPNSGRSMTTSSSEGNRCTRISPSAVLDDRLDGKDLEWARDHLRRCEACRERVEDFREMLLRVGRLPSATVGSAAMDQAFALSIPDRLRSQGGTRSFELAAAAPAPMVPAPHDLPPAVRPEVSSIPDLLTELEREIFRDEPLQDHPMPLSPVPEPLYPTLTEQPEEIEPVEALDAAEPPLREVPVDSHQQVDFTDWIASRNRSRRRHLRRRRHSRLLRSLSPCPRATPFSIKSRRCASMTRAIWRRPHHPESRIPQCGSRSVLGRRPACSSPRFCTKVAC